MAEYALNWQVLLALIVIVGFIITIVKPILTLNTILIKLNEAIERLQERLAENDCAHQKNEDEHKEIYSTLTEHSTRIGILEKEGGK